MGGFSECFADLQDPRTGNATRHLLLEVLVIALCAMLCGAEGCVDMAAFGKAKESFLKRFLTLPHGIPSHDTFSRIFRFLDPEQFGQCFQAFVRRFAELHQGVIAVDGKTLRRSFDRASAGSPLHMVSAWGGEQRLVLGQIAVDEKSNEITAVPKLLAMLSLDGCIVTADALNCQRHTAEGIIDQGGDYVLASKGNQETLFDDVKTFLDDPQATVSAATEVDAGHGRIEHRTAAVSTDIAWLQEHHGWPGLKAIGKVTASREANGKTTRQSRYYLLSTPLSAERFNSVVREHWGIENRLHWVLDVVMNEDQARNRKDNGPNNLAVLRHMALNIIKADTSKGSNRGKFKRAGWNDDFLAKLLAQV